MYCTTHKTDCASSFNGSIFHNVGKNISAKQRYCYAKFKKIKHESQIPVTRIEKENRKCTNEL